MSDLCKCDAVPEYLGCAEWECPECGEDYGEDDYNNKRVNVLTDRIAALTAQLEEVTRERDALREAARMAGESIK